MKIRGNTVGTPMKRPDFNQTNPKKSDYILNNPIPPITEADEGKIVRVSGGKYALEPIPEGDISIEDCSLALSLNNSTYVMTVALKDKDEKVVSQDSVDLPLESVVVSGRYDANTKRVILTLQDGSAVDFSVADLVDGLVSQTKHDQDIARIESALGSYITDIDTLIGEGE